MNDSSEPTQALAVVPLENPGTLMRHATDVAGVCREIVLKTASKIQGRSFVRVEGWQAIATAHGCCLSIEDVSEDEAGNVTVWAAVRRLSDGVILAKGQGFVGADERTWAKRDRYAKRAMAQTRAMSRVARSVFAHVVVLIDANLSTTPAEEMPENGDRAPVEPPNPGPKPAPAPVKPAQAPKAPAKATPKDLTAALNAFQERCKERLVMEAQNDVENLPHWQRYAADKGWILPNEGMEAILGNPTQVFKLDYTKDVAGNSPSVAAQFEAHKKAVLALAERGGARNAPSETQAVDDEQSSGGAISIAGHKEPENLTCPNCGHKDVGLSKDFDGVLHCQACAWQWDIETGDYFEEHDWAKAVCPIPPKGMPRAQYLEQPQTLGQISRQDNKRFFGIVKNNTEAKGWIGRDGKQRPPSQADMEFAEACKAAVLHMEQSKTRASEDSNVPY
jgi:hypothetical protein